MIKKLFSYIKNSGVDVYMPAKKTGKCISPYAVVNEEKTELSQSDKSSYVYFSVTVAAPIENYSALDAISANIKSALRGTTFKFMGSKTANTDGSENAYKRILTYRSIKPAYCRK